MEGYEIPYVDPITEDIDLYRRAWDDCMRTRIRLTNRGTDYVTGESRSDLMLEIASVFEGSEARIRRRLERMIREHPMGDWLVEAKTAGARVATILTTIRHPHRFPSQQCSEGCHLLPTFEEGVPCPCVTTPEKDGEPEPCKGIVQKPRPHTGCRSLWHMLGLYPQEDSKGVVRLASYRRGVQGSFNREAKSAIMMPKGIAEQFYLQGSRYAEPYYEAKERLAEERPDWTPMHVHQTAKVIAAKAWSGDLLQEWKRRTSVGADEGFESDRSTGITDAAAD